MKSIKIHLYYFTLHTLLLIGCIGAGDMFQKKEKVIGRFYLLETDDGYYELCHKTDESYVGISPRYSNVIEIGIMDSILMTKILFNDSTSRLLGINMNKVDDYLRRTDYVMQSVETEIVYQKLKISNKIKTVHLPYSKN